VKPNNKFLCQSPSFWANVRAISETLGYTERGQKTIMVPGLEQMIKAMRKRNLNIGHLTPDGQNYTDLGRKLFDYFKYRAQALNEYVRPRLMDAKEARLLYQTIKKELQPTQACPLPMNKQKGQKRAKAYLTCIVNMIIEANARSFACDYDPHNLTIITKADLPVRTLARRVDGAFPSIVNPVSVWEIKEYYYTTTFGSRVADGIYETLLDGMELQELRKNEGVRILHYLIVDAYYTWWECGRSYLCRIIDALHMGLIDEVLFGSEVVQRLPSIVCEWVKLAKARDLEK